MALQHPCNTVIIGAGPAGLGVLAALRQAQLPRVRLLERDRIGASFLKWPKQMRMISPSFPGNSFGAPDLNAIVPWTSPALSLGSEHPAGAAYARYLEWIAETYRLAVETGVEVSRVDAEPDGTFRLETSLGHVRSRFVVWAAGEFQQPRYPPFPGSELGLHTGCIRDYEGLGAGERVIVGGCESGMDAAIHLSRLGATVTVIEKNIQLYRETNPDPSLALSPFTLDRLREARAAGRIRIVGGAEVQQIERKNGLYAVVTTKKTYVSSGRPLLATGFSPCAGPVAHLLEWNSEGYAVLTECDESTLAPGLFVAGPVVRHGAAIFCFIYKFRQRFAVVARAILERLGHPTESLDIYRRHGMILEDLSCCGEACAC